MSYGETLVEKYKLISKLLGFNSDQEVLVAFKENPLRWSSLMGIRMKAYESLSTELGL